VPTLETPMSPGGSQASAGEGLSPCNIGIGWQWPKRLVDDMQSKVVLSLNAKSAQGLVLQRVQLHGRPSRHATVSSSSLWLPTTWTL